jgi:fatty-acyl-CoA synthase
MLSTMMDEPLGTRLIVDRGERLFADSVVQTFDGSRLSTVTYAQVAQRARRLASGLSRLGVAVGDRVGTLMWNRQEHLEAYLAVPAMGAVLHTLNIRLFPEQIGWIIDHARDMVLIVDSSLLEALAPILSARPSVRALVVAGEFDERLTADFQGLVVRHEDLLDTTPQDHWPVLDERSAAAMCYTSGTTGHPKGVVYSHRSIFLHSLASLATDSFGVSNHDRILMIPAMFHANAWGLPFSGWFAGADMILPGPHLQPEKIQAMVDAARPTVTAAVPTILNDLLALGEERPVDLSSFRAIIAGGSAVSKQLIERMKSRFGVDVVQGWGMTETSPMCVLSHPPRGTPPNEESGWRAKSGRPVPGMLVRIVDDENSRLPEDGKSVGKLQLRGPWVTSGYFEQDEGSSPLSPDGWLETGDVGTIDPLGYVQITDRVKDLIKSGGEWISSIELETEIARIPEVKDVAVVAIADPRWEERPLALVVWNGSPSCDFARLRSILAEKMARFMIPEYWGQVAELPKTSVGKIDKQQLRNQVASGAITYQRTTEFGALN